MSKADVSRAYEVWKKSELERIEDVYKKPSEAKLCAWIRCVRIAASHGGWRLRIIGHNTQTFSAGFVYIKDGRWTFVWITKDKVRQMPVMEDEDGG